MAYFQKSKLYFLKSKPYFFESKPDFENRRFQGFYCSFSELFFLQGDS